MPAFKKPKKLGRKYKLTNEIIDSIANSMRAGAYVETAVVMASVTKQTYYSWIKKAHEQLKEGKKKSLFITLLDAVERAQSESEMRDLMNIDKCAMGEDPTYMRDENGGIIYNDKGNPIILRQGKERNWTASAWRLERKNPKKWGKEETQNLNVDDGKIVINFTDKPDDKDSKEKK